MYTVHCTLYIVHCTLYTVHCTPYDFTCMRYNMRVCIIYMYTSYTIQETNVRVVSYPLLTVVRCYIRTLTFSYILDRVRTTTKLSYYYVIMMWYFSIRQFTPKRVELTLHDLLVSICIQICQTHLNTFRYTTCKSSMLLFNLDFTKIHINIHIFSYFN